MDLVPGYIEDRAHPSEAERQAAILRAQGLRAREAQGDPFDRDRQPPGISVDPEEFSGDLCRALDKQLSKGAPPGANYYLGSPRYDSPQWTPRSGKGGHKPKRAIQEDGKHDHRLFLKKFKSAEDAYPGLAVTGKTLLRCEKCRRQIIIVEEDETLPEGQRKHHKVARGEACTPTWVGHTFYICKVCTEHDKRYELCGSCHLHMWDSGVEVSEEPS